MTVARKQPRQRSVTVQRLGGTGRMFSAASFAGVVSKFEEGEWTEPDEIPAASPSVVAFYGFRGGAGRTTALAHVVALMAARQVNVLAIDLDVEAPGLDHVLDCPSPEEGRGVLALLRAAAITPDQDLGDALRLAPHVVKSGLDAGTPIRVLPAGRLTQQYLERLDDLGVPLWHISGEPSPLDALIRRAKEELQPQLICLDCRTGLTGLSASALFHVADVVLCFLPVSEQSLDGLDVFLKAAKAAKLQRSGRPELLIVPSMVPEGPEGKHRLDEWFVPEIEDRYLEVFGLTAEDAREQVPVVREGLEYRRGIALGDRLRSDFLQRSTGVYQAMLARLEPLLGLEQVSPQVTIDAAIVLRELKERGSLTSLPFAEQDPTVTIQRFTRPHEFKALVDRSTWYVRGAKGAGKTALWLYLASPSAAETPEGMVFIAGHGPREELLTGPAFRELESDASIRVQPRQLHGAVWLFYAAKRVSAKFPNETKAAVEQFRGEERRLLRRFMSAPDANLQVALAPLLKFERASTLAENLTRRIDTSLLERGCPPVTLLYDGLDSGFGSDEKSLQRRTRFISALVEAIEPMRGSCKRIFFKLFLREDIFAELNIQNQSHLQAATIELQWEPRDLWVLALNVVSASPHYFEAVRALDPSAGPGSWPQEEERRQGLLVPLWGAQMERGNKISTALFVQRRTADGKGRLFPRTLVQLLAAAVAHQETIEPSPDRVLRAASILAGYNDASAKRVEDLRKEYVKLSAYLDGLKGMTPTGTEAQITEHIRRRMPKKKTRGAAAGALHAGPGGWHKVIELLLEIGVLREYKRARGDRGELKYEISLLYRPGLGIKAYGV